MASLRLFGRFEAAVAAAEAERREEYETAALRALRGRRDAIEGLKEALE